MTHPANRPGMIVITNPAGIGPALWEIRKLIGVGRRELARRIAAKTGRQPDTLNVQLWKWDNGHSTPDMTSVAVVLEELGLGLAVFPLEDA